MGSPHRTRDLHPKVAQQRNRVDTLANVAALLLCVVVVILAFQPAILTAVLSLIAFLSGFLAGGAGGIAHTIDHNRSALNVGHLHIDHIQGNKTEASHAIH